MQTSNGVKKIFLIFISFYILTLFQSSFLVHFHFSGIVPNLLLISVILINLFESRSSNSGFFSAAISGFFSDVFSENFLGLHVLIFLSISFFIKHFFKKHVQLF